MIKGVSSTIEKNDLKRKRENEHVDNKKSKNFVESDINIDDFKTETEKTLNELYGYDYIRKNFEKIEQGFFNFTEDSNNIIMNNSLISKFQL